MNPVGIPPDMVPRVTTTNIRTGGRGMLEEAGVLANSLFLHSPPRMAVSKKKNPPPRMGGHSWVKVTRRTMTVDRSRYLFSLGTLAILPGPSITKN